MMAEIALILALIFFFVGGGFMFWTMREKPSKSMKTVSQSPPPREDIKKLEEEISVKVEQVCKISDGTREIIFPGVEEIVASDEVGSASPALQNPNDTAVMKKISDKVSQIRKRAGM